MANEKLAQVAREGVETALWAPLENTWCQKFARLCLQHACGDKYDSFMKATAAMTGRAFQAAGMALTPAQAGALQPGDLLYKCPPSGYGHVGIYAGNNQIAENSSASVGRVRGALGYRTPAQFGAYDLVVRLPELSLDEQTYLLVASDGHRMKTLPVFDGCSFVSASDWAYWFNIKVTWDNGKVLFDGNPVPGKVRLIAENGQNHAYIPFTQAAAMTNLSYSVDTSTRVIKLLAQ